mgnify:CR=1 FL=1
MIRAYFEPNRAREVWVAFRGLWALSRFCYFRELSVPGEPFLKCSTEPFLFYYFEVRALLGAADAKVHLKFRSEGSTCKMKN